jgi:hypothetical protein
VASRRGKKIASNISAKMLREKKNSIDPGELEVEEAEEWKFN